MVDTPPSLSRRALHAWAFLTLAATLFLLCLGGIVTTKNVGMAVPDWPTTYGYNMFLFPISRWVDGIFYEHTHRLVASGVGLMTMILAVWVIASDTRRWPKWLGVAAFLAVCIQGVLGGLRVTLYKDEIGIFHALLAQAFLCAVGILWVSTSPRFLSGRWDVFNPDPVLRNLAVLTTALIFFQLGLGAAMRHEHAGLAIPDFPLAYGQWLPDTSPEAVREINIRRTADGEVPTNALFIWIQMAHRALALCILAAATAVLLRARAGSRLRIIRSWSSAWLGLLCLQAFLGAWTIWSGRSTLVATAHMTLGAVVLLVGALFSFRLVRACEPGRFRLPDPAIPVQLASRTA